MKNKEKNKQLIMKHFPHSYWHCQQSMKETIQNYDIEYLLKIKEEFNIWNDRIREVINKIKNIERFEWKSEKEKKEMILLDEFVWSKKYWLPEWLIDFELEEILKVKKELNNWKNNNRLSAHGVLRCLKKNRFDSLNNDDKKKEFIKEEFEEKDYDFYLNLFKDLDINDILEKYDYIFEHFYNSYHRLDRESIEIIFSKLSIKEIERLRNKENMNKNSLNDVVEEYLYEKKMNSMNEEEKKEFLYETEYKRYLYFNLNEEEKKYLLSMSFKEWTKKFHESWFNTLKQFISNEFQKIYNKNYENYNLFKKEFWLFFTKSNERVQEDAYRFWIEKIKEFRKKFQWTSLYFIIKELKFEERMKNILNNDEHYKNFELLNNKYRESFTRFPEIIKFNICRLDKKDFDNILKESNLNNKLIWIWFRNVFWMNAEEYFKIEEDSLNEKELRIFKLLWEDLSYFDLDIKYDLESKKEINEIDITYLEEIIKDWITIKLSRDIYRLLEKSFKRDEESEEEKVSLNLYSISLILKEFWDEWVQYLRKKIIQDLNDKEFIDWLIDFKKKKWFTELIECFHSYKNFLLEEDLDILWKIENRLWIRNKRMLQTEWNEDYLEYVLRDNFDLDFIENKMNIEWTSSLKRIIQNLLEEEKINSLSSEEKEFHKRSEELRKVFWRRSFDQYKYKEDLFNDFTNEEIIEMFNYFKWEKLLNEIHYWLDQKKFYVWVSNFIEKKEMFMEEFWRSFKSISDQKKADIIRNYDFEELKKVKDDNWIEWIWDIIRKYEETDYWKKYKEFLKYFWHWFSTTTKERRNVIINCWLSWEEILKKMKENWLSMVEFIIIVENWYLKDIDWWKIFSKNCWCYCDIDDTVLYRISAWLKNFCTNCHKKIWITVSIWEKQVFEFIKYEIYSWEIIENWRLLVQDNTHFNKEIDIFLKDIELWIEYDWIYWHNEEDDNYKNKLAERQWILLLRINEKDWSDNQKIEDIKKDLKEKIINRCIEKWREDLIVKKK